MHACNIVPIYIFPQGSILLKESSRQWEHPQPHESFQLCLWVWRYDWLPQDSWNRWKSFKTTWLRPTRPSPNYTPRNYVFIIVIANQHDHLLGATGQPHKCSKANNESTGSWPNPLSESWFLNRARITPTWVFDIFDGKMSWLVAKVRSPGLWGCQTNQPNRPHRTQSTSPIVQTSQLPTSGTAFSACDLGRPPAWKYLEVKE